MQTIITALKIINEHGARVLAIMMYVVLFIPMYTMPIWVPIFNEVREEVERIEAENKLHDIAQLHHCKVYQEQ